MWKVSPICFGVLEEAAEVEKELGGSPRRNTPYFAIANPPIITKLVQDQMAGQIFDELLEIKSAKCC